MSIITPEIEIVNPTAESLRYLEHGWPSEYCRWHSHDKYELHLIVGGSGKAFVGDHIGTFKRGSLFLVGPNLPHNWVTKTHQSEPLGLRDMLVQFSGEHFSETGSGFYELRELLPMLEMARSGIEFFDFPISSAYEFMCLIRDSKGVDRMLAFLSFLDELNKHADKTVLSSPRLEQSSGNKNYDRIGAVVDHISNSYNKAWSVADAAALAGMSETSFSRNFQNTTGNRFTDFVNQVRIGHACLLLLETNSRISSICYQVGFQNLANFNRHFFKLKNITPSGYRNSARKYLQQTVHSE